MTAEETKPKDAPSYHDTVVYLNGKEYRMFNHYHLWLICTRVSGWELWDSRDAGGDSSKYKLLGGEFHYNDFRVEVKGVVICETLTRGQEPKPLSEVAPDGSTGWQVIEYLMATRMLDPATQAAKIETMKQTTHAFENYLGTFSMDDVRSGKLHYSEKHDFSKPCAHCQLKLESAYHLANPDAST